MKVDPKGMDGNAWIIWLCIRTKSGIFKENIMALFSYKREEYLGS
jgi:hypothetical protein